jgi:hypothetical protein
MSDDKFELPVPPGISDGEFEDFERVAATHDEWIVATLKKESQKVVFSILVESVTRAAKQIGFEKQKFLDLMGIAFDSMKKKEKS